MLQIEYKIIKVQYINQSRWGCEVEETLIVLLHQGVDVIGPCPARCEHPGILHIAN